MQLVPILSVSSADYALLNDDASSVQEKWIIFRRSSRVVSLCVQTHLCHTAAMSIVSLFENELTQCSTVQENYIQMKESAAGRCKELLTGLLQSQELHLEDCVKFHQLFVDEFLSLVDALSFVLTEPNVQAVVELEMEVHTPAVPPALQA